MAGVSEAACRPPREAKGNERGTDLVREAKEPGTLWREPFRIRSFDVDPQERLNPRALFAFLQEAAGEDAARYGAGMRDLLDRGLAWVLQRLRLEVARWPLRGEAVVVTTGARRFGGVVAERAFQVSDEAGRALARAASRWAVVDVADRRPVRLPGFIKDLPTPGAQLAFELGAEPGRSRGTDAGEAGSAPRSLGGQHRFEVRRADLDLARHMNNTRYVEWALEMVTDEWLAGHELAELAVVYRREARLGNVVAGCSSGAEHSTLLHTLSLEGTELVLAHLASGWRTR